ncbi:apolipoprotein N-acyltransferase [Amphritea balenae]|uniref:Apolipoprotein N-acyltransferase n=1 Tax=Amphritea balenae TaxID=452629 RepID=A0A3P1SMU1_9GAMM|nr:apolipoprotein N-acyltransferase [Amphritea balenae]RRC98571.1 apolipoprotein N-acyltransferase [Amphritea balenae]GGK65596.1 apolipoprotein N-acyltransferase [Amphritea balenae]
MAGSTPYIVPRVLLSLIAGVIAPLSLAPFNYWYLGAASVALLYLLLHNCSARAAGWLGWCYGLGFFGTGVSWVFVSIHEHGNAPIWLAASMTALFVAALAILPALQCWLSNKLFRNALGFAALWLVFEWLRSWFLTGFPWLYLGYGVIDTPLAAFAPFGGVWILSLYVVMVGTLSISFFKHLKHPLQSAAILVLLAVPWIAIQQDKVPGGWTLKKGEPLDVMLVQADIPQAQKWQPSQLENILQTYVDLSMESNKVDLLIWPETAIPTFYRNATGLLSPLTDYLDESQTAMISGIPSIVVDPDHPKGRRFQNTLTIFAGGEGSYNKQRLVPFGEYVPLEAQLRGLIEFFDLPMSEFSLGDKDQAPLSVKGSQIAPFICYEIAYPELVRQNSINSDLLLTVSNDTWFGQSIAPAQHMQIARMRALETGRWLIRSTNNGVTALVNPQGQVTATIPQYQTGVLVGSVQPMSGQTPYQTFGIEPLQILIGLMLIFAFFTRGSLPGYRFSGLKQRLQS